MDGLDKKMRRIVTLVVSGVLVLGMVMYSFADGEVPEDIQLSSQVQATDESGGSEEPKEPEESGGSEEPKEPEESGGTEEPKEPDESGGTEEPKEPDGSDGTEEPKEPEEKEEPKQEQKDNKESEPKNSEDKSKTSGSKKKSNDNSSAEANENQNEQAAGSAYVIPRNNRERAYDMREDNVVLSGDYNGDGLEDLYVIQKSDTESGQVEVHILDGESNFYTYLDEIVLPVDTDDSLQFVLADYNPALAEQEENAAVTAHVPDLYVIKEEDNKINIKVLDGEKEYVDVLLDTSVERELPEERTTSYYAADFNNNDVNDLCLVVQTEAEEQVKVDVIAFDGSEQYQTCLADNTVMAAGTIADIDFGFYDYNEDDVTDLYIINKRNTDSGKVEVSILDGNTEYTEFLEEKIVTHEDTVGAHTEFTVTGKAVNLNKIDRMDTGSGSVEAYLTAYRGSATIREGAYLEALKYEGIDYVWGGESLISGVDCSGLVKVIYEKFGINLAHYSMLQRFAGEEVSVNDMLVGDLICYNGHIGFYAGDNKMFSARGKKYGIMYHNITYNKIIAVRRLNQ